MSADRESRTVAIALAAALLVPLVAGTTLAAIVAAQSPLQSAADAAPLLGTVEAAERTADVQVTVAVEYAPTPVALTAAGGTVTAVGFSVGDTITTGTRLVAVDDRDVIAYTSDAPLYRDLSRGATGRDVSTAQSLLATLGYDPGAVNGTVGSATVAAIRAFNAAHGYGISTTLSLAALSWVGTGEVTVAESVAVLGQSVSPGSVLLRGVAAPVAIAVKEGPGLPADEALELVVASTVAAYEGGSGRVTTAEDVAAIAATIGTADERVATVRRANPVTVGTVPSAAVVTDASGRSCIFAGVNGAAVVIQPLGGSLGTVDIDASLVGEPVLLNPREVRTELSCA